MEIINVEGASEPNTSLFAKCRDNSVLVSCNWQITNNKQFIDVITTASLRHAPAKINCEDVAFLDTCIALQPSNFEPCMLDIKVTNHQKIARIAVVSEGNVLEIFKQYGEYETTIFAEFIDEYEENAIFLGETTIEPPTTETSIKFARTKNKSSTMWVYGIRLFLTDSVKETRSSAFNPEIIQTFFSKRNDKMSQKAEMAMKLLGCYNEQEIVNKEQFCQKNLEKLASNSEYRENKNGVEREDNEKECSNCENNYEKSNSAACKSEIERRDNENERSQCLEVYKKSDMDIKTCRNSDKDSIQEAIPGAFKYKDFIRAFNNGNCNMSQEAEMTMRLLFGYCDKQQITNNKELHHGNSETLTSNLEYLECKKKNGRRESEKECSNYGDEHEKPRSFENSNVRQAGKKDHSNCEDNKNSDIDIKTYIDNKFYDLENKLIERINEVEVSTSRKLDAILERLETLKLQ